MSEARRLTRSTPVSACEGLLAFEPLLVGLDTDVVEILRRAAVRPSTRLIGVIDDDRRLVGVLPIRDLVEAVVARVMPEALMTDVTDVEDLARFGHVVGSKTAVDVMQPPAAVVRSSTIARAFREMQRRGLSGVYVVDDGERPVGYLDALELAYQAALGEPLPGTPGEAPTGDATSGSD